MSFAMSTLTGGSNAEILIVLGVVVLVYLVVTRNLINPLKTFPGPILASLTRLYVAYHETIRGGRLLEQLEILHKQYGPVVRIGPNLLHFSDPRAYSDIYNTSPHLTKEIAFYQPFGDQPSSFNVSDQREHKFRRDLISPFFSRRAISKLENVIQEKVDLLIAQIQSYGTKSIDMSLALRSATTDIITSYCFATDYGALTFPDFQHPLLLSHKRVVSSHAFMQNFPLLAAAMKRLPNWALQRLSPGMEGLVDFTKSMGAQVDSILANPDSLREAEHETIFHHLLESDVLKSRGQALDRRDLIDEAELLVYAGSDTVGNTCTIGIFHVLNNPDVHLRLRKELEAAWPDVEVASGFEEWKRLPYLTAVIKESLRLSHGAVSRLPRSVGSSPIQVMGQHIPAGTVVSMSPIFMHWNEDAFPNPRQFDPNRWLQPNAKELETYLVPFSRGLRSCVGINLAWCELYLIFANVFRKLDLEIDGTTVEDLAFRAYFIPKYLGRPFHIRLRRSNSAVVV